MTTIADVARAAGVGVGTASRVLNGSPHVAAATRARVHAAIEQLGYHQTRGGAARSKPRRQVGVLVPLVEQPGTAERLRGLVRRLQPHGADVVVMDVDSPARARERIHELPRHTHLAGLIVMSLPLAADEGDLLALAPFPAITLDTSHPRLRGVAIDDRGGGRIATDHLLSLGHRRLAVVGEPRRGRFGVAPSARREEGAQTALQTAGVRGRLLTRHGRPTREVAHQLALDLLGSPDRPTAIITGSDDQAIGVLDAARDLGIDVPGGLSVIASDDSGLTRFLEISTLRRPLDAAGERAADLLLDALATPDDAGGEVELLDVELIARGTTGAAPERSRRRTKVAV